MFESKLMSALFVSMSIVVFASRTRESEISSKFMQSVQLNSVPPVIVPETVKSLANVPDPMTWSLAVGLVVPIPTLPVLEAMVKMLFAANTFNVDVDILNLPRSSSSIPRNLHDVLAVSLN